VDDAALRTHRWSRVEYDRLIDCGLFGEDARLELLDGVLVVREPQGSRHSAAVVVRGAPWDYASGHPTAPLLLVEIAETSLAIDRRHKGSLYARAGITDSRRQAGECPAATCHS